ncbi:MAG: hypothetical protein DRH33_06285 [Candidatus Nealsonbacteria bacterium]|nr:MAG: hypothetical protein DRH33_06285 [Candidatus Nealsonbacteria bacterium]
MLNLFYKLNFKNIRRQNSFNLLKIILVVLISIAFFAFTSNAFGEITLIKQLIEPDDILLKELEVTPSVPAYPLPLSTTKIINYKNFLEKIQLSPEALSLLKNNGFVVIPTPLDIAEREIFLMSSRQNACPKDDFVAYYNAIGDKDLPIFITTDSLLHYYHIFFDTTLMKLERDLFYKDIWAVSKNLLEESLIEYYKSSGDLKEAAKRNVAYLSVGLELLKPKINQIMSEETLKEEYCHPEMDPEVCKMFIEGVKQSYGDKASFKYFSETESNQYSFEVPNLVKDLVQKEIELIEEHKGWEYSPLFIYQEDYSQYVPRGHYVKSEKLKNYFKTLMWYGRITALIGGSPLLSPGESICTGGIGGIISEYDARIQTLQAFLLTNQFSQSQDLQERWNRIYAITSFLVGFSDDLGPTEYSEVLKKLFKDEVNSQEIEENYLELKETILDFPYNPKIYSGLGACELLMPCPPLTEKEIQALKLQAKELLGKTKGFRLMGQRFTLDSWLFSEIVSPYSGEYVGPKPPLPTEEKPFTFTWDDIYAEYRKDRPFTWVKTEVQACPPPAMREVKGFPRGLDLMALLGSERAKEILESSGDTQYSDYEKKFTELKKEVDSFSKRNWSKNLYLNWLYVLKSLWDEFGYGYPTFMQTEAWQDKELNTALASWTELRHDTLLYVKQSYTMAEMGGIFEPPPVVGYVEPVPEFYARLLALTKMTNQGFKSLIPQQELEKLMIEAGLDRFTEILSKLLDISKKELENISLNDNEYNFIENFGSISEGLISTVSGGEVDPEVLKTVLVADVHTDGNTEKVLEEGVGYIKTAVIAYKLPEGHILIGIGPTFSYYEFKQPMENRLTDEEWREILDSNPPPEPEWVKTFSCNN